MGCSSSSTPIERSALDPIPQGPSPGAAEAGSHYFHTPEAGGKVSKTRLTQVGRALKQLGIGHIAAYSPQARGRCERAFRT